MKVLIDADACPVYKIAVNICEKNNVEYLLVSDVSHRFDDYNIIYVDGGSDAADYKIVALTNKGDIVITQDYGLASMILSKKAHVINQNGMIYSEKNIMSLLESRALSSKLRKHKTHLKGPKKRTDEQDDSFIESFTKLLLNNISKI